MASAADIATLRQLVNEPDTTTYTDEQLGAMIDSLTVNGAAADIWARKAASLSESVDMTEGGSSRKNSDLLKNAITMRNLFAGMAEDVNTTVHSTQIRKITRR
mgnify:CR=1 FL=1